MINLFSEIGKLGNWKLIYGDNITPNSFFEKIVKLGKLNAEGLFDLWVSQSPKNQRQLILRVRIRFYA